jgi:hypothetical protein
MHHPAPLRVYAVVEPKKTRILKGACSLVQASLMTLHLPTLKQLSNVLETNWFGKKIINTGIEGLPLVVCTRKSC